MTETMNTSNILLYAPPSPFSYSNAFMRFSNDHTVDAVIIRYTKNIDAAKRFNNNVATIGEVIVISEELNTCG